LRMREQTYMENCQRESDQRISLALAKFQHLPAEIESLKAVMEMKNDEIHQLRRSELELRKEVCKFLYVCLYYSRITGIYVSYVVPHYYVADLHIFDHLFCVKMNLYSSVCYDVFS